MGGTSRVAMLPPCPSPLPLRLRGRGAHSAPGRGPRFTHPLAPQKLGEGQVRAANQGEGPRSTSSRNPRDPTPAYAALLKDRDYPELARRFRAQALMAAFAGHSALTCRLLSRAAWACNDESVASSDAASECRRNALAAMQTAHIAGESVTADRTGDEYRRWT